MATSPSPGIGPGLQLNALLDKLTEQEKGALKPITRQQTTYTARLTAYGTLKNALTTFQTANKALNTADLYSATTATVRGNAFSATSGTGAVAGKYPVTISQLAQAQTLVSGEQNSTSDPLGTAGATRTLTIAQDKGKPAITLNLTDEQTSLTGLRDAINGARAGVTASIIKSSTSGYCLSVSADATGTSNAMTLSVSGDKALQNVIGYSSANSAGQGMTQQVAAQDAHLTINNVPVVSASNTVSDVLEGITLNLTATTSSAQTLTVAKDTSKLTAAVSAWVEACNKLQDTFSSLTAWTPAAKGADAQNASNGALIGDSTLRNIQSRLKSLLINSASTSSFKTLAQMGITQDASSGKLIIDSNRLSSALSSHSDDIKTLLPGDGKTTGITTTIGASLTSWLSGNGSLTAATKGTNETLKKLTRQYNAVNERINGDIERYRKQFTRLDILMSSLNKTSDYLTQQFSAINGSSSKS